MVPKLKIYDDPSASKERCKVQTAMDFILKTRLFGSKEEGVWRLKAVYFHNLSSNLKIIPLLDPENSKNSKRTLNSLGIVLPLFRSLRFVFCNEVYYLNRVLWDLLHHMSNLL